jgi:WD repeat and SOF domain-containing protein 1
MMGHFQAHLTLICCRWKPFDPTHNWPDLGPKFKSGEDIARAALEDVKRPKGKELNKEDIDMDAVESDKRDLDWSAVLKRTFEAYLRGERPNMYGEWLQW